MIALVETSTSTINQEISPVAMSVVNACLFEYAFDNRNKCSQFSSGLSISGQGIVDNLMLITWQEALLS